MKDVKHRRGTSCGGRSVPKTAETRKEKRARASGRRRNEEYPDRLDEIRQEIIDQAEKRLRGEWRRKRAE